MPSSNYVVSVDLGGTHLRIGAVREDGAVEEMEKGESESRSGSAAVIGRVAQGIRRMAERVEGRGKIAGVALGFPGIVDCEKGIVYQSPHFPDWKDLDILSYFKKEMPWPVTVDNDANMAALGEGWKGAGSGLKNFVMLTLGTGVGGGIVIDGRVFHGDRGFAGEVGHIGIEIEGPRCACGSHGCLETFVSARGIMRLVEESDHVDGRDRLLARFEKPVERLTVKELYEAALNGDIFAHGIFKKMGRYLGGGIASLTNTLGIENFILGGGVAQAWDFFIEPAKKELAARTYRETAKLVQIKKALLGDNAALVGGATSVLRR